MVLMSSAAVLAIYTKPVSAAAADAATVALASPGDSAQLQALIDRYLEKKSIYRDLELRRDKLKELEGLELEDVLDEAHEQLCQALDKIEDFEARSMADVKIKARFAVDHLYENEVTESSADYFAWCMLHQLAGRTGKGAPPEQAESGVTCDA